VKKFKIAMLATGSMDQFEVTLESLGPIRAFQKRLSAPYSVRVSPENLYEPLKIICDGIIMYGHIPYEAASGNFIVSPTRMLSFLQGQGYEVLLSPEYEQCKVADEMPLTKEQEREKVAFETEHAGVVY
jgi:hypothetical protein